MGPFFRTSDGKTVYNTPLRNIPKSLNSLKGLRGKAAYAVDHGA